jgi:hypothetical protein
MHFSSKLGLIMLMLAVLPDVAQNQEIEQIKKDMLKAVKRNESPASYSSLSSEGAKYFSARRQPTSARFCKAANADSATRASWCVVNS